MPYNKNEAKLPFFRPAQFAITNKKNIPLTGLAALILQGVPYNKNEAKLPFFRPAQFATTNQKNPPTD